MNEVSEKRTIYLSGPMTGYPGHNYPLFNTVARVLRRLGHTVYNPAEFKYEGDFPLRRAFAEYTRFICEDADTLMLLPGWEKSVGAKAEFGVAKACEITILELDEVETLFYG